MTISLASAYPWVKSLHVISIILWMGAQFLLPMLLMAHRGLPPASAQRGEFLRVARWLVGRVMNPAMIAAFIFGGILASVLVEEWRLAPGWLGWKLLLVLALSALHGRLFMQFRRAADDRGRWADWQYRWVQGLNLALLAGVVVLAVAKPFP